MNPGLPRQYPGLVAVSVLASIALSAWCVWADPIINNDGVYYLRAATEISAGNWRQALSVYPWPFYSAFIALLGKLPGMDLIGAAHVLNALFAAVLVAGFLSAVYELGGNRTTLIIAALLVLAFPTLNKYRSFIIRDVGYLAFHIWSLCFLFRYWKEKRGRPLVAYPNSGETWDAASRSWSEVKAPYELEAAVRWRRLGARLIGGCCRVGPEAIRALRRRLLG